LVRERDERGGGRGEGLVSCAHWLSRMCGVVLEAAHEKMRVAHALARCPRIAEAFARGEVRYSKVRAMTRVARPDNEALLMRIARHGTAAHMEKRVRKHRRVAKTMETEESERVQRERARTRHWDAGGSLVLAGGCRRRRGRRC